MKSLTQTRFDQAFVHPLKLKMKRTVSVKGRGTMIIFTNTNAKIDTKGISKKTAFFLFTPTITAAIVTIPKAMTQII